MGIVEFVKTNTPNGEFLEWCERYEQETPGSVFGYRGLTKTERCKFRKKWKKMHTHTISPACTGYTVNTCPPMGYPATTCANTFTPTVSSNTAVELSFVWLDAYNNSQINKENNMATIDTGDYAKRDYLERRLNNTYATKYSDAHRFFHMEDDEYPRTGKEMIDRFAKGLYVYEAEAEKHAIDQGDYTEAFRFLSFRDPSKPRDTDGFKAFVQKLDTAKTLAKDEIRIVEPEAGLKALRDFEAFPIQ